MVTARSSQRQFQGLLCWEGRATTFSAQAAVSLENVVLDAVIGKADSTSPLARPGGSFHLNYMDFSGT